MTSMPDRPHETATYDARSGLQRVSEETEHGSTQPAGHVYRDLAVSDSGRLHAGDVINNYTYILHQERSDKVGRNERIGVLASLSGLISLADASWNVCCQLPAGILMLSSIKRNLDFCRSDLLELHQSLSANGLVIERAELLNAHDFVSSCTHAVLLFDELYRCLQDVKQASTRGFDVSTTGWSAKASHLDQRLQWQRGIWHMQRRVLTERSTQVVRISQEHSTRIRERVLHDAGLERRMRALEDRLQAMSVRFDAASVLSESTVLPIDRSDPPTLEIAPCGNEDLSLAGHHHRTALDEILSQSWVYRRNDARSERMSFRSSVIRSHAWTDLSYVTLADISIISVIALPITISELSHGHWYLEATTKIPDVDSTSFDFEFETDLPTGELSTPEDEEKVGGDSLTDDEEDLVYLCRGCDEILEQGKAYRLEDNRWHIDCFRCNTCGTLLDSDANLLLLGDGSLICDSCTYSCVACNKKIEDLAVLTGDQAYCSSCFKCRNCKRKIENLRYARTSQGVFCMPCHESLMARRRKKQRLKEEEEVRSNSQELEKGNSQIMDQT